MPNIRAAFSFVGFDTAEGHIVKPPAQVSTNFTKGGRSIRCVEVVTRDGESMRGFVLGALSCVAIVAGITFFMLAKAHLS